jgi:hypothetical protein
MDTENTSMSGRYEEKRIKRDIPIFIKLFFIDRISKLLVNEYIIYICAYYIEYSTILSYMYNMDRMFRYPFLKHGFRL